MMGTSLNISGDWSVNVYKGDGSLRYSIGPRPNFITQTGLSMIMDYAIADCFRYLSLGYSATKNSIVAGSATTGLYHPTGEEAYYVGGRTQQYDASHETSAYTDANFKESLNTVTLSRSWRVPAGDAVFKGDCAFKEFMLSPGRPYATGISSTAAEWTSYTFSITYVAPNTNITVTPNPSWTPSNKWVGYYAVFFDASYIFQRSAKILASTTNILTVEGTIPGGTYTYVQVYPLYRLCYCGEYDWDLATSEFVTGPDYAATADEYRSLGRQICGQTGAFVRVTGDIPVSAGDYLTLSYDLKIIVDSGINGFQIAPTSRTATKDNKQDSIGVNYPYPNCVQYEGDWIPYAYGETYISGLSTAIHHGLKLINPGSYSIPSPWWSPMPQMSNQFSMDSDYGEGFVSSWGCPLEPYLSSPYLSAYISNDWLQFAVSPTGGIGIGGAYQSRSGLMGWRNTPYDDNTTTFNPRYFNIRMPNTFLWLGNENRTPNPRNYTDESQYPETATGYYAYNPMFATITADVSVIKENYAILYGATSRLRSVQRNLEFAGNVISTHDGSTSAGFDMTSIPLRFLVMSFVSPGYEQYHIPYFDVGFGPSGGYFTPLKDSPSTKWLRTGTNAANNAQLWHYLQDNAKLTYWFKLYWTSPCYSDVDGCP